jgi:isochorismate synthase EntC
MTTMASLAWQSVETRFGYRYRAEIPRPTWTGLLGQAPGPVWAFSGKDTGSVFVGSGIHRSGTVDMFSSADTDVFFLSMFYESVEAPVAILSTHLVEITDTKTTLEIYADSPMTPATCQSVYEGLFANKEDIYLALASREDSPSFLDWTSAVSEAQRHIQAGVLEKIVLSRQSVFARKNTHGIPMYACFSDQLGTPGYHYFYRDRDVLMGHSPEALLRLRGDVVSVDVVAGTRLSLSDQSLLASSKDLAEHDIVLHYVHEVLAHYGKTEKTPRTEMSVGSLTHLYQLVYTQVARADLQNLIRDLHPTPALCGFPKTTANDLIATLEKVPRSWYGGILGVSVGDHMDLAVSIRGLYVTDTRCEVRVGAGIVAASDPEKEWQELNTKLQSVLSNFAADLLWESKHDAQ